jgi:hypothetical protein
MRQHREGNRVPIFLSIAGAQTKMKIPITPEFTAIVTGHGKTICPCNEGQQTREHLIYECKHLEAQRSSLIKCIMTRGGDWPPANDEMVATYLNAFTRFIKSTDFQKLQ